MNEPMESPCPPVVPPISWSQPSGKSLHSLPLGNGEVGINVWVEPPGDMVFYVARTDSWSEHGRLLKLGRIRLSLDPPPFGGENYLESLDPASATARVEVGHAGSRFSVQTWVDAHHPVVRIKVDCDHPVRMQVKTEIWREHPRELTKEELRFGMEEGPCPLIEGADTLMDTKGHRLAWFHRNETSIWASNLDLQGLSDLRKTQSDPLLHRTFGCAVEGEGLEAESQDTLQSPQARNSWSLTVTTHTAITPTVEAWRSELDREIEHIRLTPEADARHEHVAWWKSFWERSWIEIQGDASAKRLAQAYQLQRYYLACAGRGTFPIKFNGSLFAMDYPPHNPDYRRWGGAYWFQNTRLAYWPMLAAGDTDLMPPLFRMFATQLPLARFRTRKYFGHDGAYFGETQNFWGTYQDFDFGWDGKAATTGEISNSFIRWQLNGNLELLALMLSYHAYTGSQDFVEKELVPMATELIRFFDQHYPLDKKGLLRLVPGQALETYWDADNNTPDVAGLRDVLDRLLTLPDNLLASGLRDEWQRLRAKLPDVPIEDAIGLPHLLPAEKFGKMTNYENPELYAIFPFQLYGVGRPHLEMARNSYAARRNRSHVGWSQDEIHAAFLGLAAEARKGLESRFSDRGFDALDKKYLDEIPRFPAVWGPNFDWMPDMDHGGVGMLALQSMLLQADTETLHILPAWPVEWDVSFKLWAPDQTTIIGSVSKGHLVHLDIHPGGTEKAKVVVHQPQ